MKKVFICSFCHHGVLGGGIALDDQNIRYRTGKLTIDQKYRDFKLSLSEIEDITWKWAFFPLATFRMKDGNCYKFLIFNKWRFEKAYQKVQNDRE